MLAFAIYHTALLAQHLLIYIKYKYILSNHTNKKILISRDEFQL